MDDGVAQPTPQPANPSPNGRCWPGAMWGGATAVALVAGLVFCLRGAAGTPLWVLLALSVPLLGFLFLPACRMALLGRLRRLRDALEAYPVQTPKTPWLAVFVFVMAPAAVLLLSREFAIVSGDATPVILTSARLTTAGDCDLTEYVNVYMTRHIFASEGSLPYFLTPRAGAVYSAYPSGMVPFALPTTAAARLLGADLHSPDVLTRLDHWTAAWVAAACLGLFFLLALHLAGPKPAWIACLLLATGSVIYSTVGQTLWQHGGVIFWALAALLVEFRRRDRPSLAGAALQGLALAMMLACRLTAGLFIVPFGIWVLCRSPRQAAAAAGFACLAFLPWAWFYHSLYGSPFGPSVLSQSAGANWDLAGAWSGAAGVLASPARGVLVYQPWLLLAALGALPALRRSAGRPGCAPCPQGWGLFLFCFALLHLSVISAWRCWWGGCCWGSRLAAEPVVLAALLCVRPLAALGATAFGRRLTWAAVVLAGLLHIPAVYLKEADWNNDVDANRIQEELWSWSDPPFAHALLARRPAKNN